MFAGLLLHAFREPYILSFYLGFILLAIALVAEAASRNAQAGALLLVLVLLGPASDHYLFVALRHFLHRDDIHSQFAYNVRHDPLLQAAERSPLPLAFGDHVLYSADFEYGDPALRARMVYPVDIADSAPYPLGVTSQINFQLFGPLFGWHAPEWQTFARQHPHFLLLRGTDPNVWFFPYLVHRMQTKGDLTMRLIASSPSANAELYEVQLTP